ncbi:MAG: hypothetical protein QOF12_2403 [Solirubrobacteraceae bacterium]|jgi:hypothetical protein|nr:hypothetical protein [Solirubrobacteraceae bacterium]
MSYTKPPRYSVMSVLPYWASTPVGQDTSNLAEQIRPPTRAG